MPPRRGDEDTGVARPVKPYGAHCAQGAALSQSDPGTALANQQQQWQRGVDAPAGACAPTLTRHEQALQNVDGVSTFHTPPPLPPGEAPEGVRISALLSGTWTAKGDVHAESLTVPRTCDLRATQAYNRYKTTAPCSMATAARALAPGAPLARDGAPPARPPALRLQCSSIDGGQFSQASDTRATVSSGSVNYGTLATRVSADGAVHMAQVAVQLSAEQRARCAANKAAAMAVLRAKAAAKLSAQVAQAAVQAVLALYPRRDRANHVRSIEAKRRRRIKAKAAAKKAKLQILPVEQEACEAMVVGKLETATEALQAALAREAATRKELEATRALVQQERSRGRRDATTALRHGAQMERRNGKAAARKRKRGRELAAEKAVRKDAERTRKRKQPVSNNALHSSERKFRQRLREACLSGKMKEVNSVFRKRNHKQPADPALRSGKRKFQRYL